MRLLEKPVYNNQYNLNSQIKKSKETHLTSTLIKFLTVHSIPKKMKKSTHQTTSQPFQMTSLNKIPLMKVIQPMGFQVLASQSKKMFSNKTLIS